MMLVIHGTGPLPWPYHYPIWYNICSYNMLFRAIFFVNLNVVKHTKYHVGIEIDKLTNSIVNTISGDSFPIEIHGVDKNDLKNITKKNGWMFSWSTEYKLGDRKIYKLTIKDNVHIVQGLVASAIF